MFVEGLHIYRMLTEMRNINHGHIRFYYAIGWGIPAIITGETTTHGEIPKHTLGPETEQQLEAGLHVGTCLVWWGWDLCGKVYWRSRRGNRLCIPVWERSVKIAILHKWSRCESRTRKLEKKENTVSLLLLLLKQKNMIFRLCLKSEFVSFPVSAGLAVGLDPQGYGNPDFCWLSVHDTLIWSFAGPIFVVVLVSACLTTLTAFLLCAVCQLKG